MSGMVGVFRRDGAPVRERLVNAMAATLAHRGPDGTSVVCAGSAGLGHTMLWTTQESLHEVLPHLHRGSGLIITADARIDNRDELIAELALELGHPAITDSGLILEAYHKWGQECVQKLLGDFAFAIWDPRQEQFFCARDPMGVKCLYYFASDALFAFGSEIKALCCLEEIPKRLNELRILDYLENSFDDRASTFYRNIYRLPAASTLLVTRRHLKIAKYWSLDAKRELKLKSDEEYTEAFRECFVRAVRVRMRSAFPIGSTLSGGLDSSSIACVARSINESQSPGAPVHTFSLIFPSLPEQDLRHIDERKYMQDVLALGGFQPHFIHADELSPMKDVKRIQQHLDEASCASNLYLHWSMFDSAHRAGVRVFFDGFDGDTTVSDSVDYLRDLAVGLRWKTLRREAALLAANMGCSTKQIIRQYSLKPLCPETLYRLWGKARGRRDPATTGPMAVDTFSARQFKQRLECERGFPTPASERKPFRLFTARANHRVDLEHPAYSYALESADKASAAFELEARYPFFDRRLIELCLSLPSGQKLGQGWPRLILRKAMTGYLPQSVQWRFSKSNLGFNFHRQFFERDRGLLEDALIHDASNLTPYVDLPSIREAYNTYRRTPLQRIPQQGRGLSNLFGAVNLAVWLRTAGVKP
jgi:asparagine synthase (glutamine-hydrolysing)